MQFQDLLLHPALLQAVREQGYLEPTPIQAQGIPIVLQGRDVLACAQTGSGKTAAFALPLLHRLIGKPRRGPDPRVLVLVPTRELATQVNESFTTYGRYTGLRTTVVYGGVKQGPQVQALRAGVDVLVAAPGRLLDLMSQRCVSLRAVEALVLDEADRMLDMGFIDQIRDVVAAVPKARQTLMFSATMPDSIRTLAMQLQSDPAQIAVNPVASTVDTVEQNVFFVDRATKADLLVHLLSTPAAQRVLVFTRTKDGADRVGQRLGWARIQAEVIHGDKAQRDRERALERFKEGSVRVLVATDVAARGIDVEDITHVINYDMPYEPESYVHRIGRTARAGAAGVAVSFCDGEERAYLKDIERLIRRELTVLTDHPFAKREKVMELNNYTPPPKRTIFSSRRCGLRRSGSGR